MHIGLFCVMSRNYISLICLFEIGFVFDHVRIYASDLPREVQTTNATYASIFWCKPMGFFSFYCNGCHLSLFFFLNSHKNKQISEWQRNERYCVVRLKQFENLIKIMKRDEVFCY